MVPPAAVLPDREQASTPMVRTVASGGDADRLRRRGPDGDALAERGPDGAEQGHRGRGDGAARGDVATSDPEATLEIVGKPVIASYTDALHRFVRRGGTGEAVTFRGHASDDDLAAAYARADVLVVASVHEGFGVPLIEAMSVGLPIVCPRPGALPEVVGGPASWSTPRTRGRWPAPSPTFVDDPALSRALAGPGGRQLTRSICRRPATV